MSDSINGDLSIRASADTSQMDWTPSPSGTVWRKRVHLVGLPESGQVTSVVRYEPKATFPPHDHPDGEEIFVLEGVFSDEHGDWGAGTYLLNPEGFRHAPFSEHGCVIFVKLRQYAGQTREHVAVDSNALAWDPTPTPGVSRAQLYAQSGFRDTMALERWAAGANAGLTDVPGGIEIFVVSGELIDEKDRYAAGCWLRLPAGSKHCPRSDSGCVLYVKRSGLADLRSA